MKTYKSQLKTPFNIVSLIISAIFRIGTEFGFPVLCFFVFSHTFAVAFLVSFLLWQLVSVVYLAPLIKREQDKEKQLDTDYIVVQALSCFRIALIGKLDAKERVEIIKDVEDDLKKLKVIGN